LWPNLPSNLGFDWSAPADADGRIASEIERAFASAAHIARVELFNQRLAPASMEPRVATASYDAASGSYTMHCATQGASQVRTQVIGAMKLKPEELRVLTEDVGGGFGMKASGYPEYVALLHAARTVARPVHWASTRAEAFMSDNQARDLFSTVELALDGKGRFLALRVNCIANVGAYMTLVAHFCSTLHISGCLPTVYVVFDGNGQPLSGSFMDYAMPRAELLPNISVDHHVTACRTNPLGVKGTGEAGTTAAPPVIINAILDALPKDARAGLEMPATAERVWRALQAAN
jgi:CO/xanthine dehydrogenase Mo-binding subunit